MSGNISRWNDYICIVSCKKAFVLLFYCRRNTVLLSFVYCWNSWLLKDWIFRYPGLATFFFVNLGSISLWATYLEFYELFVVRCLYLFNGSSLVLRSAVRFSLGVQLSQGMRPGFDSQLQSGRWFVVSRLDRCGFFWILRFVPIVRPHEQFDLCQWERSMVTCMLIIVNK